MTQPEVEPRGFSARLGRFWARHRTLFWTLHSLWSLSTGAVVIVLARERYGLLPWVVLFLFLTWASTLYFGRRVEPGVSVPDRPGFAEEATSYLTREMYQQTLFFLIPFYVYSTVFDAPSALFTALLATLALFSCLDLIFDRWMRSSPIGSLTFFAVVSFAAANLLLPIVFPIDPTSSTRWAAGIAVAAAIPTALRGGHRTAGARARLGTAALGFLLVAFAFPWLVPAVPLRVESVVFSPSFDPSTLTPGDTLGGVASRDLLDGGLYVLVHVFAPSVVPARVSLVWERDGEVVRTSREISIMAHETGFRIWDAWKPADEELAPGRYRVVLRARGNRVFGTAAIIVRP